MRAPLLALLFALTASGTALAEVKVVATLPSLAAIAAEVGGPHVSVTALAAPTEDPHYVDPRPSLILALNQADLLVQNGLELEVGWLPKLQVAARNARIQTGAPGFFDAGRHVRPMDVPQGKVDRAQGDIHQGGNPHFLFDPRQGALVARALGEKLAEIDPGHAADYRANAGRLAADLERFASEARAKTTALPSERRRVVTYHASLTYLLDWLGLEQVATIEPKPGIPPDPAHVAKVLTAMRERGAKVVLQEEFYPKSTSQTLAKMTSGRVVTLPGSARFSEKESYLAHLTRIVEDIRHALADH